MKDGICQKCKAENVRFVDGSRTPVVVPTEAFSQGAFTCFYVCGECGFLEIYVENEEDLPKINEAWKQVRIKK